MRMTILLLALSLATHFGCSSPGSNGTGQDTQADTGSDAAADAVPQDALPDPSLDTAPDALQLDTPRVDTTLPDVVDDPDAGQDAPADTALPELGNDTTPEEEVWAPPGEEGTPEHPVLVSAFPFVQAYDTSTSPTSQIDLYACADWLGEEGPELYYRVTLPQSGTLKVEVLEQAGVDVDIHLLSSLAVEGGMATDCIDRSNTQLRVPDLAEGEYWVVIDSCSEEGEALDGAFWVAFELDLWDQWQVIEVSPGMTWKKKIYSDYCGGPQTINVLEVDLGDPALAPKPYRENGCIHPSEVGDAQGARAAINAGFFAVVDGCPALSLIRIDGQLVEYQHLDGQPRRAFGLDVAGNPLFADIPAWTDWPEAFQAISGHPNLVTAGGIDIVPWAETSLYTSRHPRTGLGVTTDNHLLLVTVDGRTEAGAGMTLQEFAQHFLYLGAVDAINLDGGGSTTMWIPGMSINGIVNHPSDNELPDHWGERAVSDAFLIH